MYTIILKIIILRKELRNGRRSDLVGNHGRLIICMDYTIHIPDY